jgi:TonB family protein
MVMKPQRLLPIFALVALWGAARAQGTDIKVIANSGVRVDTISAAELKRIFLEENNSLSDGTHVAPVLQKNGSVHETFLKTYLDRTDDDLQNYYRALLFSGRASMPKEVGSNAEMVAYVAKTRGAIGYVGAETSSDSVKVLKIANTAGNTAQRNLIKTVEPEYPETLRRLKISGTVRLQITISAKGNVENVLLLGGNPILGDAAIAAVKQWVYSAGPSRTIDEVTIPFPHH